MPYLAATLHRRWRLLAMVEKLRGGTRSRWWCWGFLELMRGVFRGFDNLAGVRTRGVTPRRAIGSWKLSDIHANIVENGIMAVEACVKPKMFEDDDDDDDGPTIFRRNNTASKKNQLNLEIKKSSSQKYDGPSGRRASDVHSSNGQNSSLQKGKLFSPAIASTLKSAVASSNASTSLADRSKHSLKQNSEGVDVQKKHMNKPPVEPNSDSEDDKPLSLRLSAGLTKNNSHHVSKGLSSSTPSSSSSAKTKVRIKKPSEDFEDEILLSSKKFLMKSGAGVAASKSYNSHEEKPLSSKCQQNGTNKMDKQLVKSPKGLSKRPLGEANTSGQSSLKKLKLSDASVLTEVKQVSVKAERKADDDDHIPIAQRMKKSVISDNKSSSMKKTTTKVAPSSFKKITKKSKKVTKNSKYSKSTKLQPNSGEGQKWTSLVHSGVIFPPPYKPHGVKMLYNGRPVELTPEQEEVATMFAVMKDTEYATKQRFIENFMNDWRAILGKNHVIKKFELCDFTPIYEWNEKAKERKKQMSTEEKKALKEEKLKQEDKYMWANVDGVKEKCSVVSGSPLPLRGWSLVFVAYAVTVAMARGREIGEGDRLVSLVTDVGNFRVEPPGLFRGRGEHPKMGKLKRRIRPSDITINIGKGAPIPECPIPGERWKEVKHDNTVTWLAFWNDPINPREFKYVFLAASSSLKGQSDKEKYEKARLLKVKPSMLFQFSASNDCSSLDYIHNIRATYTKDFISKDATKRQIAVATYLIDKLALRAGNEKDDDEADTVGCCTLKVENVTLVPPNKLQFDFLGKDSIRYFNTVEVELLVYKAIGQFKTGKGDGDDLFDKLDTSKLNAHLKELMPGLTAKVFRTYNASITLDEMLNIETKDGDVAEKIVVYQHANKEVAIICNHQRSVSKSHSAQMSRLNEKMDELKVMAISTLCFQRKPEASMVEDHWEVGMAALDGLKIDLARAKKGKPPLKDADGKPKKNLTPDAYDRKIAQTNAKVEKMERDMQSKEDLKTVALGTSKINYLDPRISVAWCKRLEVPIEKIFNKSLLAKFTWAMDVDPDFRF
ncbi:hypothetical protein HHK36_005728 [Tetracentron sinense]|uniref:DNA topoisomerase I n=1 Tax=Tetracentron sinense TaxID=13715 RepID=A0A834ZPW0_TETSI|nr:hypothetical protein HHK36_005728 [Tetracentron sinense]